MRKYRILNGGSWKGSLKFSIFDLQKLVKKKENWKIKENFKILMIFLDAPWNKQFEKSSFGDIIILFSVIRSN